MTKDRIIKYNPFVSIICVTYNRRPFFPTFFQCIRNQDYPASRYEIIIVDDGTDKIKDLVEKANIPQLKYFAVKDKMTLGMKRNYSHTLIDKRSKYISYFDDDDYHCPNRISHAVEILEKNKTALCAGSSEIYLYFKHIEKMYKFGPYGPNHATAGTFTFRRELLDITKYDDYACLAEEKSFLKDYTIPFVQLDPFKCILVISHEHNTFDKRKLLENPNESFVSLSDKTVDTFISKKNEIKIKKFFLEEIDSLLLEYDFGDPKHKPDVLNQLKNMEIQRNTQQIIFQTPGQEPRSLSNEEVVNLLVQQQNQIQFFTKHVKELEEKCRLLQSQLLLKI
jgi:glycosyltransferase involved in cell wall biosynthesis